MRDHARPPVIALAVAAVLAACAPAPEAAPKAVPVVTPAATAPAPPRVPSGDGLPGQAVFVTFAGADSAFVLLAECEGEQGTAGQRCRQHIGVLEDGRWHLRRSPLPDITGDDGITADIRALAPGQALVTVGTGRDPDRTWVTADGARTWTRGTTEVKGTVDAVPPGALLVTDCRGIEDGGCVESRLALVMPGTGEHRALATQPALTGVLVPAGTSRDGARWVSGVDPATRLPALAVTHDAGRTWQTRALQGPGREDTWGLRVVDSGTVLYAVERGQLPPEEVVKNGLRAIHRSTDNGRTWERVWSFRPGRDPRSVLADVVVTPAGTLILHAEDGVYRSEDGGRTFSKTAGGPTPGTVTWTPIGYVWSHDGGPGEYKVSLDGLTWHTFVLGGSG
ncbi:hypothetical protein ABGB17_11095 [Sphaerisporangium sp. B11E5]|uniref:WD40/YVTN/BNR-like repeat-containing protein n=1 Tax=Sphaerisporangium sp. B11E5 TaxID=3153563 RepID=UPI00325CE2BE